jgi:DNA-binding NtrC family response regulator
VEESSTGRAAIQQLRSNTFNLAVIDWRLTDITGLDVAEAMQDDGVLTPRVLVSGYIDFEIARKAGALGAVKAVGYPVDIHALVTDALKEALDLSAPTLRGASPRRSSAVFRQAGRSCGRRGPCSRSAATRRARQGRR